MSKTLSESGVGSLRLIILIDTIFDFKYSMILAMFIPYLSFYQRS